MNLASLFSPFFYEKKMLINHISTLVKTIKYLSIALFATFVLGAFLLAVLKDRLPAERIEKLRRFGWIIVGIAFLLTGAGMLMMTFSNIALGVATRISRDGSRVSIDISSSPVIFTLVVGLKLFFSGFVSFIGFAYLRHSKMTND